MLVKKLWWRDFKLFYVVYNTISTRCVKIVSLFRLDNVSI